MSVSIIENILYTLVIQILQWLIQTTPTDRNKTLKKQYKHKKFKKWIKL